jgi:hypothetical protein
MTSMIQTDQAIATVAVTSTGCAGRLLRGVRAAATGFLAFLGDAIVQLAVEDFCMAFVTAAVSAVVGIHIAA